MHSTESIIAAISIVWAAIALVAQVIRSRGKGRVDYSVRAGNVAQGIIYNFTWAMTPGHKETIRLHPFEFIIGFLMHIGIFLTLARTFVLILYPHGITPLWSFLTFSVPALCGFYLLIRRTVSAEMRMMSSFDDYFSNILTVGWVIMAMLIDSLVSAGAFLIYTSVLFFYFPLGKLRHAVFFFIARADYGARLGYRGTYPAVETHRSNVG